MTAREKGFTLMEIMVSLAVLAIVLGSIFKLQSSTIVLAGAAQFKSLAPVLARQQLALLEQHNYDPGDLDPDRAFEDEYRGYSWSCEVVDGSDHGDFEDILSDDRTKQMKKITLTIYSPDKTRSFTMETWRFVTDEPEK